MSFIYSPPGGGGGLSFPFTETQGDDTAIGDYSEFAIENANIAARASLNATGLQASGGGGPDVDIDSSQLRPIGVVGPGGDSNRLSEFDVRIDRTTDGRLAHLSVDSALGSALQLVAAGGASEMTIAGQSHATASAGGGAPVPATVLGFIECTLDGSSGRIPVFAP